MSTAFVIWIPQSPQLEVEREIYRDQGFPLDQLSSKCYTLFLHKIVEDLYLDLLLNQYLNVVHAERRLPKEEPAMDLLSGSILNFL